MVYFVIVGTRDDPLYELEFGTSRGGGDGLNKTPEEYKHFHQFIAHSSLDVVEDQQFISTAMYLKSIDKFNDWIISAYIAPSNTKFVILHDTKNDDGIKNFFHEVQELFVKTIMNPFYEPNSPITSATFDTRIRAAAKRYL